MNKMVYCTAVNFRADSFSPRLLPMGIIRLCF
jgi:hypothetical protein